jgi:hypothetical protein
MKYTVLSGVCARLVCGIESAVALREFDCDWFLVGLGRCCCGGGGGGGYLAVGSWIDLRVDCCFGNSTVRILLGSLSWLVSLGLFDLDVRTAALGNMLIPPTTHSYQQCHTTPLLVCCTLCIMYHGSWCDGARFIARLIVL